ncbi:sodium:alanine symporter family protein [filamentous cyanobacterium CCP1]|nr:sodium:alanine symporter family protein [filamentous cyanobacterium CCP2]PSB67835.1 sodium:alanine symporter family protein [filamentous cyanobacterium CCP1]
MEAIEEINSVINGIVWGPPFMILLIGTGLFLTVRLGFFQFTHLVDAWNQTFGQFLARSATAEEQGTITSFQAVSSAMAGTIGVGNIAGVSTALALGGPGAVFWMWMSGLVGMATKFGEAALGVRYREIDASGNVSGGVMYYIEKGLGSRWRWLAVLYALLAGLAAFGIGNMVQANTVAQELNLRLGVPTWATGIAIVILVGAVTLGGITRIASTAEKIVPFMAILYVAGSLIILLLNLPQIPGAIASIFANAFSTDSITGATVGLAIRYGIARGIFSNEAGLGAASIVHAQARNTPARQGMWGMWEVFIDTIIVCSMTALVILVTNTLPTGATGAELASTAFDAGIPAGGFLVMIGLILFAYTTMLTWNFYGEKSWEYVFGRAVVVPYRFLFLAFLFIGAIGGLVLIWDVADTLNGLMAAPNLIALLLLSKPLVWEKNRYLRGGTSEEVADPVGDV